MNEIHGYCGYRCDLCPAFVRNQKGPEDRQRISDGWQKYLGFRMEPETIVCAGCRFEGCHLDRDCQVRPCAMAKSFGTCAECAEFGSCEKLTKKADAIAPYKERLGSSMPEEDFRLYLAPYESRIYLARLRQALKGEVPISSPPAAVDFSFLGYDLIEEETQISALINCGGFPDAFANNELNSWQTMGLIGAAVVVLVAHTYKEEEDEAVIRIISARKATSHERRLYEQSRQ